MPNGRDRDFQRMLDRVEGLRGSRRSRDEVLRDFIRSQIESTFTGVNNRITNEAEELRQLIDTIYDFCGPEVKPSLDQFRLEIDQVLTDRQIRVAGALLLTAPTDTPEEHLRAIMQLSERINNLIPLCRQLDSVRRNLDTLYTSNIQGR